MQQSIIERLSKLTDEEQFLLVRENTSPQKQIYAKSGRFIIERRHISNISLGESTAAISMRQHPRFRDFPLHSHDYVEIMYVCNGSITHVFDGEEVTLHKDDIIVLAGKGHETYQEIHGVKHHMDEREIVAEILEEKRG